ncbi:hypothetical protein ACFFF5_07330 [Lederbergia wuyishanensis]|uniref:Transposase n=1 Tax=Lederbergia wuyishanensis TaxID=1347903 RepID=A0ABU0D2B6_9BACI|nr:hypothetical protein [Lederbergia wuyishanensis]MCJ8007302.1 hypothetical protein [Lederbergia wuyishanensis]MDQ0342541.1 transposase [Lederbergia wuyishanensis]
MLKLEVIMEVHKRQGFKVAAITRKCNLFYVYLEMDFEEACKWVEELRTRERKLDFYQDKILDWLEERCNFKDVGDSTVRTYVRELREKYHIPKSLAFRSYKAIEELSKGKQMLVDFGESKVKTSEGKIMKLYVMAFVLSHTRCPALP